MKNINLFYLGLISFSCSPGARPRAVLIPHLMEVDLSSIKLMEKHFHSEIALENLMGRSLSLDMCIRTFFADESQFIAGLQSGWFTWLQFCIEWCLCTTKTKTPGAASSVMITKDGKLIVVDSRTTNITKFFPDGQLDTEFGQGGFVRHIGTYWTPTHLMSLRAVIGNYSYLVFTMIPISANGGHFLPVSCQMVKLMRTTE